MSTTTYDDYLFDLHGFLILRGALTPAEVAGLNATVDGLPAMESGGWHGHLHCQEHHGKRGLNLQQIYEAGEPFERLIDHPSWIDHVRRYSSPPDGLFIDENFFNIRGPGQSINIHSGGHSRKIRTQFRYHDGRFHCGQINVLIACTDIGPGDGATMVIPGSHKSNLPHPSFAEDYQNLMGTAMDGTEEAVEVHLAAGDAILFVDCLCHGSAERRNPGERRICVFRYGPAWGQTRFGYQPSPGLVERLTPEQQRIVQPIAPQLPPYAPTTT